MSEAAYDFDGARAELAPDAVLQCLEALTETVLDRRVANAVR